MSASTYASAVRLPANLAPRYSEAMRNSASPPSRIQRGPETCVAQAVDMDDQQARHPGRALDAVVDAHLGDPLRVREQLDQHQAGDEATHVRGIRDSALADGVE